MVFRITPRQRVKINALVCKACCNCYKGNCLLLDDGEETKRNAAAVIRKRGFSGGHSAGHTGGITGGVVCCGTSCL